MGRPLTEKQHEEIIACYKEGHTLKETADITGYGYVTVSLVVDMYEVKRKYKYIRYYPQEVIDYYYKVIDLQKVAEKFNITVAQVRTVLLGEGVPQPREYHTQQLQKKIKGLFSQGYSQREIGEELGISYARVNRAINQLAAKKQLYS